MGMTDDSVNSRYMRAVYAEVVSSRNPKRVGEVVRLASERNSTT